MLVIYAEKASLAKNIAVALTAGKRIADKNEPTIGHWEFSYQGEQAVICHGVGHLITPAQAKNYDEKYIRWNLEDYPCIPTELKLTVKEQTKHCYNTVSGFFKTADWLINATDPDREGELIFALIYQSLGCTLPWKRAFLEDTTTKTIYRAFQNLKDGAEMIPLQNAGYARQYADWILGINLTVAMTKKFGSHDHMLSVGRVQTPTLALVVNREKEIQKHTKKPYWKLVAKFTNGEQSFFAEYSAGNFTEKEAAENILANCINKAGSIQNIETKDKHEPVPLLYNATQLRIAANKAFGWDLKYTDKIMQSLYEKRYMTYPRSSSEHLPVAMEQAVKDTLLSLFRLPEYQQYSLDESQWQPFSKRHFDDSKVGSHTAIIPTTEVPPSLNSLGEDEQKLYDFLAKSVMRIVYPPAVLKNTTAHIDVNGSMFKACGTVIITPGWFSVDSIPEKLKVLPTLNIGEEYTGQYKLNEETTKPPKRYTQATLIETMELAGKRLDDEEARTLMKLNKMGLGTEATRTGIVQQLFNHEYIKTKGKSIVPTEKGIFLIDSLPIDELKSAEMTGEWEKKLNDISLMSYSYEEYKETMIVKTENWYQEIVSARGKSFTPKGQEILICPACGKALKKQAFGFGCSDYKNGCRFTLPNQICGKKLTETQQQLLLKNGTTNIIKGFKSKTDKKFDAKLKLNPQTHKIEFDFPNKKK